MDIQLMKRDIKIKSAIDQSHITSQTHSLSSCFLYKEWNKENIGKEIQTNSLYYKENS